MSDEHWIPKRGHCMAGHETSCYGHSEKALKLVRGTWYVTRLPWLAKYLLYISGHGYDRRHTTGRS